MLEAGWAGTGTSHRTVRRRTVPDSTEVQQTAGGSIRARPDDFRPFPATQNFQVLLVYLNRGNNSASLRVYSTKTIVSSNLSVRPNNPIFLTSVTA